MLKGFWIVVLMVAVVYGFFSILEYFFKKHKARKAAKKIAADSKNDVTSLEDYNFRYRNIKDE